MGPTGPGQRGMRPRYNLSIFGPGESQGLCFERGVRGALGEQVPYGTVRLLRKGDAWF